MEDLLLATSQMETQHPAADNPSSNQTGTSLKLDKFSSVQRGENTGIQWAKD
jgi:hypothetical protein